MDRHRSLMGEDRTCSEHQKLVEITFGILLVSLAIPFVFFEGLWGSDDMAYVDYALKWDRLPQNHWETRLLYNALLRGATLIFGRNEVAYALPGLLGSMLLIASGVWHAGRTYGRAAAVTTGVILATLPMDVIFSTVPVPMSLMAGLAAAGTVLLVGARRRSLQYLGCVVLALAIMTHMVAVFYVGALTFALVVTALTWKERLRALASGALAIGLFAVFEFSVFGVLTGDPLYELRVIRQTHPMPTMFDSNPVTLGWFLSPVRMLIFSKGFDFILPLFSVAFFH